MSEEKLSRYLSYILRHNPESAGIQLDEHGWADVSELLEGIAKTRVIDREILEKIVAEDEKNRYSYNEEGTKIRANQGHSISVDVELKKENPPDSLWHGTAEKYVHSIEEEGLRSMTRLYVHLSSDVETAKKVGSRHGKPVIYEVDTKKMKEDGFEFFLSQNGVWLTKTVPVSYLRKMESPF